MTCTSGAIRFPTAKMKDDLNIDMSRAINRKGRAINILKKNTEIVVVYRVVGFCKIDTKEHSFCHHRPHPLDVPNVIKDKPPLDECFLFCGVTERTMFSIMRYIVPVTHL